MRIAFAGNPNSGKTTMYNALTGRNERVGNWAGVTVERKESLIKKAYYDGGEELVAVDLPGAYSMSPFTSEESITSSYVKNEHPDAIINIVDATNLSRSLFFTTQLLELGVPVVVALNKSDLTDRKQTKINEKLLSEKERPEMILGTLISAYVDMYRVKLALVAGEKAEYPAQFFNYKGREFRLRNAARDANTLSVEELRRCLDLLGTADRALKSGTSDEKTVLERLLVQLSGVRARR